MAMVIVLNIVQYWMDEEACLNVWAPMLPYDQINLGG